ncbi:MULTISPECIES: hypothetical protein [Mycolicibacterium]|uniref:Uncharacterized protein n=1 Tax=Mycolicibacterium senegalense TaxID=1796 RepID=A0A378W8F6_9MYCO|nr:MULTISPECIES: hypothetical protein [Mycolicibacterium]MCV7337418.1 hypothetical protein [Mycolicibacterium senegalense]MDR7287943.1 hypothetical protein [Mycolicibacterium senegalense]QZA24943.1 hypothetical protein K3U95_02155 [Mycolicibacterium senegalense]CDP86621.1 hypothetical protein BN975_02845 [Mycolicibacterium farcinogenes]SUA28481.1 Uncharacterised protein [Mycolicibacterium senegalense]
MDLINSATLPYQWEVLQTGGSAVADAARFFGIRDLTQVGADLTRAGVGRSSFYPDARVGYRKKWPVG